MAIESYLNAAMSKAKNRPKKVREPGSLVKKTKAKDKSQAMAEALMSAAQRLYGQK